jgi:hypothetical protein
LRLQEHGDDKPFCDGDPTTSCSDSGLNQRDARAAPACRSTRPIHPRMVGIPPGERHDALIRMCFTFFNELRPAGTSPNRTRSVVHRFVLVEGRLHVHRGCPNRSHSRKTASGLPAFFPKSFTSSGSLRAQF